MLDSWTIKVHLSSDVSFYPQYAIFVVIIIIFEFISAIIAFVFVDDIVSRMCV